MESGSQVEGFPVRVVTDPSGLEPVRWVLLAVKSFDTQNTAPWLRALCDENTTIVVLQNGVTQTEGVQDLAPRSSLVPALVYIQAEKLAPGRIRLGYGNRFQVPEGPWVQGLVDLFRNSGMEVDVAEDLTTAMWLKLILNIAVNPLTALTLRRMEVFQDVRVRELALGLMREAAAVGVALGARLTEEDVQRTLAFTVEFAENNGTSMLYDRLAGRPLEYDALNGAVVRHADALGIDVPLNRAITALLQALRPVTIVEGTAAHLSQAA
ncbi:2-dehydropantoate 2-reductase [Streptomyces fumigatiscleroticus]|nr:2-dehydropantoate 2-reductase [Streptomyces fumigatiscleroticus]